MPAQATWRTLACSYAVYQFADKWAHAAVWLAHHWPSQHTQHCVPMRITDSLLKLRSLHAPHIVTPDQHDWPSPV